MNVYVEKNAEQHRWGVHICQWHVNFRARYEAEQFCERPTARLNAAHSQDMRAGCSICGHGGMTGRHAHNSRPSLGRCAKEA